MPSFDAALALLMNALRAYSFDSALASQQQWRSGSIEGGVFGGLRGLLGRSADLGGLSGIRHINSARPLTMWVYYPLGREVDHASKPTHTHPNSEASIPVFGFTKTLLTFTRKLFSQEELWRSPSFFFCWACRQPLPIATKLYDMLVRGMIFLATSTTTPTLSYG